MKFTIKYYFLVALVVFAIIAITGVNLIPNIQMSSLEIYMYSLASVISTIIICAGIIVSKIEKLKISNKNNNDNE